MASRLLIYTVIMEQTTELLKTVMDICQARQSVLANNVANVETPAFKRKDINFKESLEKAINSNDINKIISFETKVEIDQEATARIDGNTVSTQTELGKIAQNSLLYDFSTMALSRKYQSIRQAIKGK